MDAFKKINKAQVTRNKRLTVIAALCISICLFDTTLMAQEKDQVVRLAKIKVDASQLEKYIAALKVQ